MISHQDILDRKRNEEMKEFRRYLVDQGVVKCIVKMLQHTAKEEMRLDRPGVVHSFLQDYVHDLVEHREAQSLAEENDSMRQNIDAMQAKVQELNEELGRKKVAVAAANIWQALVDQRFWEVEQPLDAITLEQLYTRLCGKEVDPANGVVLADLLRPSALAEGCLQEEQFREWVQDTLDAEQQSYCVEELSVKLDAAASAAPFEVETLDAIRSSGLYPQCMDRVAEFVKLNEKLMAFLSAAATRFAGEMPPGAPEDEAAAEGEEGAAATS